MFDWIREIDRLLRGAHTGREVLESGKIDIPVQKLVVSGFALGALYGVCMGLYAVLSAGTTGAMGFAQLAATTLKVPLLFLFTLVVTFPSLYVFSALSNSRLGALDTCKLLLAAVAVNLAVLASFGPVTAFFTLSTKSYPFMIVMNVFLFAIAGFVGLLFLWRALWFLFGAPPAAAEAADDEEAAPEPATRGKPRVVLAVWTLIYALVGAQMGWILRPFIGSPDLPFALFRHRESSFFEGFFTALGRWLVG